MVLRLIPQNLDLLWILCIKIANLITGERCAFKYQIKHIDWIFSSCFRKSICLDFIWEQRHLFNLCWSIRLHQLEKLTHMAEMWHLLMSGAGYPYLLSHNHCIRFIFLLQMRFCSKPFFIHSTFFSGCALKTGRKCSIQIFFLFYCSYNCT